MSLLQKASIITTPTAYAEDYLYSIKPAIPFGDELVTNGNFYSNSDWNLDSGWSISGGKLIATNTALEATQTNVFTPNKTYQITFTIDSISSGSVKIKAGTTNGSIRTTAGTYTQILTVLFGTNLVFDMHSSGSCVIDNVSAKEVTNADFDFDRNSTGTRVNEDYLIEDVPYNLLQQSEDATTIWIKTRSSITANSILAPNGTLTGNKFIATTASGDKKLSQSITVNSGEQYTLSVFAKKGEFNGILLRHNTTRFPTGHVIFNLDTGVGVQTNTVDSFSSENVGNGWYRLSVTSTADSTGSNLEELIIANNGDTAITGNDSDGIYIWGMQTVKGDQPKDYLKTTDRLDIPRIDYTNGEPSILLEPQSTNLCTHSVDFATGVSSGSFTLGSSSTLTYVSNIQAPDGTMGVYRLQNPATSGTFLSFYTGNSKNVSVYVKAVDVNKDNQFTLFKSSGTPNVSSVFTASNRWERFDFKYAQSSGNTGINNEGDSYVSDVYIWGAQVEDTNSYATSLIHTSGSTVTRSADAANNAANSDLINSTEGVLYVEIKANSNDEAGRQITLNDSTIQNSIQIKYTSTNNRIDGVVKSGGVNQATMQQILSTVLDYHKVAVKYKANDCSLYVDGQEMKTDTSATMPVGLKQLNFDNGAGSSDFLGNCKMIAVFKEALTDLELEKLTGYNNHELYMNYYNRLSYLGLVEEYNVESDINNYIL